MENQQTNWFTEKQDNINKNTTKVMETKSLAIPKLQDILKEGNANERVIVKSRRS